MLDETIIEFLDGLKKSKSKDDSWEEQTEEQQTLIQAGIDDVEKENVISESDFCRHSWWLKKYKITIGDRYVKRR